MLPVFVADDGDHGRAGVVVSIGNEAAGSRAEAKGAEVVAGNELAHDGARSILAAIAADGDRAVRKAGFHGGKVLKFRKVLAQLLPGVGGEEGVSIVVGNVTAADAALVRVTEADEGCGIGNRKVAHEDRIDEGKDGGVGADAEGQGEDGGCGEARGLLQLPHGIANVLGHDHWLSPERGWNRRGLGGQV